jgi:hypothetical protein
LETIFTGKWIVCVKTGQAPGKKTATYAVQAKDTGEMLASIRWYGPWRKYTMFPAMETVWESTCLREVAFVCTELTKAHQRAHPRKGHLHA